MAQWPRARVALAEELKTEPHLFPPLHSRKREGLGPG